ncbi:MAG: FHA domain-containing protein [Propionibacteriaceae bacterium]|nr:FHA domain-containing protein [Propionibacteriaceae bacterium]
MTLPMAAWRVTYTPGDWLVLSGPTMLVVMLPAPPRMSQLVNTLWDDVVAAKSVDALLALFGEYGLDGMPDFAAFFWDVAGLHGMARGNVTVVDTDTGEAAVTGSDVVTWREEALGSTRNLRVDMQAVDKNASLQLPLVVGAVSASAIYLSTDPASQVRFPDLEQVGVLPKVPLLGIRPMASVEASDPEAESPVAVVGLGDETEMEPYEEPAGDPAEEDPEPQPRSREPLPDLQQEPEPAPEPQLEPQPEREPEPGRESQPEPQLDPEPKPEAEPEPDVLGGQQLMFDADDEAPPSMPTPRESIPDLPIPPPVVSAPVVVPGNFQVGDDDDEGGTIFSTGLAATHKPPAAASIEEQSQVLAVPCARGHANPQGSRQCRICSAPVDSSNPRLINRPALAGVHSNKGEFANLQVAVLVGRSPDAAKAPRGAHLMRVPSPSSDISRSHLLVAPRDWSVIVTDLNSTNGTTIIPVGEQSFVLANGQSVQVDMGTVLDLGDGVSLRIEPPRG